MTPAQVSDLLTYCAAFDPTLHAAAPEDHAVRSTAWATALAQPMPFDFAMTAAAAHYASTTTSLTPAHLNAAWRVERDRRNVQWERDRIEAHCGRSGCACTHDGCFKGWLDQDQGPTRPCPNCRPSTARRVRDVPAPGHRDMADLARLRDATADRE